MTDSTESPILGWVAGVKSDEEKQRLTSPDNIAVDSDYTPDNKQPAPVPSYNDFPIGNIPANGKWGLTKKEQHAATYAHKREKRSIKKREQQRRRRMRQRASTQNNSSFTGVLPTTATVPNTAIPSLITTSPDFSLKPLEFKGTTPSISTGPADGTMIGRVPKRNRGRHHHTCNTYPSAITYPVSGRTYVNTATQTEPEHICIGDCQCSIRNTPTPTAATAISTARTTATTTAEPLARRLSNHVPRTQRMLALRCKANARSDAFRREAGIEPPKFD